MKKMHNMAVCLMAAATMTLAFSSCMDDDTEQSMVLSGQWQGDFGMFYEVQNRRGQWMRFDSYDTDIVFYPDYDYATHGHGKQVDYYDYGPYERQFYTFYWTIRNGVLYLDYPYDPELNTAIYDYRMTNDYFSGYFGETNTRFRLRKLVDYYDWGYYNSCGNYWYSPSYCYGDYYGYYGYAPSRTDTRTDGEQAPAIRRGNRFKEAK